jgi:HAD superfamily hydrolase (TIGR01509 family)
MIKLVLFDLDGVLVDTKKIHFESLNHALVENGYSELGEHEHTIKYDGLTTKRKLDMMGIPDELQDKIFTDKQNYTWVSLRYVKRNEDILDLFLQLKEEGYKIGVCSNAIEKTVDHVLDRMLLTPYLSVKLSSADVSNPKPHPEIYWEAMSRAGVLPEETVIIEDSPTGLESAYLSGANVIRVSSPEEVDIFLVDKIKADRIIKPKWKDEKLNVLIPMAGAGSRFADAGYTFPKPLIDVNGKPMIQTVVDNIGMDANYIFVVQKEHREKYNLDSMLGLIAPNCKLVEVDGVTEGAACTTLLAEEYINNDNPLFIANSDQYADWSSLDFMYKMNEYNADGGIVTFKATHPKWSYAKADDQGLVTKVAEKNPISDNATVGFYYWKRGSDYVKYANQMIESDERVNGEFYVCPVFNQAIEDNKKIHMYEAEQMWGLGTPEDLERYLFSTG